jgi:hypothetical protein
MRKLILLLLLLFALPLNAESERLDLKHLKQLVLEKKWVDAVAHLSDIAPSERDQEWRDLVEASAVGYLKALQADGTDTDTITSDLLRNFAILRYSRPFMEAREEAGLHDLERCYADYGESCLPRLRHFLDDDPANPALALEVAKIVAHHGKLLSSLPFFAKALTESTKGNVCQDETFQVAWIAAMSALTDPAQEQADTLATDYCWPALKDTLEHSLETTTASGFLKNACKFLKKHSALDDNTKQKCGPIS